jgi:spore maturation protein CgeB
MRAVTAIRARAYRWDLGYLGTYSPDRQPTLERLLIEPARRLPHLRFVVAGPQYPDGDRLAGKCRAHRASAAGIIRASTAGSASP